MFDSLLVCIVPEKQSILDAMELLLARYLEILPLFFEPALTLKHVPKEIRNENQRLSATIF